MIVKAYRCRCDICGKISSAEPTREISSACAEEHGWIVLSNRIVCRSCAVIHEDYESRKPTGTFLPELDWKQSMVYYMKKVVKYFTLEN